MSSPSPETLYSQGTGAVSSQPFLPVFRNRDPNGYDTQYEIGQRWINSVTFKEWTLFKFTSFAGLLQAVWELSNASLTEYVVGPSGLAPYQTVQSALDAANAASTNGAFIFLMPTGTSNLYVENLQLYSNQVICSFQSTALAGSGFVGIAGTHQPPATGSCGFYNLVIESVGGNVIVDATLASTAAIQFWSCKFYVTNGYILSAPSSTAAMSLYIQNCIEPLYASTDDGIINHGGASLTIVGSQVGGHDLQTLTGQCVTASITDSHVYGYQLNLISVGSASQISSSYLSLSLSLAQSYSLTSYSSQFVAPGSLASLVLGISATATLYDSLIQSSATNSVTGPGSPSTANLQLVNSTIQGNGASATVTLNPTNTGILNVLSNLQVTGSGMQVVVATASGASPQSCNGRFGQVTFSGVSIAASATQSFEIDNTSIGGATTIVWVSMSGNTSGSALSIQSVTPASGKVTIVVSNGAGATTSTANIIFTFWVMD